MPADTARSWRLGTALSEMTPGPANTTSWAAEPTASTVSSAGSSQLSSGALKKWDQLVNRLIWIHGDVKLHFCRRTMRKLRQPTPRPSPPQR